MYRKLLFLFLITFSAFRSTLAQKTTFCNPMNLDYGFIGEDERHGADPVIVLFNGKYYLFDTNDTSGYRVSDDLAQWNFISFDPSTLNLVKIKSGYTAPAVATDGKYLYFMKFNVEKDQEKSVLIRTQKPESGKWEKVSEIRTVADPTLFFDNGRIFIYHGLMAPIKCFELDPKTFTEIQGSEKQIVPDYTDVNLAGWESLTEGARNWPCCEGSWIIKRNKNYYLTYATPGTASKWHSDGLYTSSSPTGPFNYHSAIPESTKPGGFIGSTGHSCIFQDRYKNWWQVTSMWIGVKNDYERRLGLLPVDFDEYGNMHALTEFGDYPIVIPSKTTSPDNLRTNWNLLSHSSIVSVNASSELDYHPAKLTIDESVRSWWSATTGNIGEWLTVDLGQMCQINAIQINFAEQDCTVKSYRAASDVHKYRLLCSTDNQNWTLLIDRNLNEIAVPHDYHQLSNMIKARYLRIENTGDAAAGGKFALREIRAFGKGAAESPTTVSNTTVLRSKSSPRNCWISWNPSLDATGYLIRYGPKKNKMFAHFQTVDTDTCLWLHTLANDDKVLYYFRIDAYNSNGFTVVSALVQPQQISDLNPKINSQSNYRIINRRSNKSLGVSGDNTLRVVQQSQSVLLNQNWIFALQNDGFYKITNVQNHKVLNVENESKNRKAEFLLSDWTNADSQKWGVIFSEKGHIKLLNKNSNYYMEIPNGSLDENVHLVQSRYFDFDYQEWILEVVNN